jgi:D-alanine transfer protein
MERARGNRGMPHLYSALIACGFTATILFAGGMIVIHLERNALPSAAPKLFPLKNQGLAFQRAAAHAPNVLLFYGSSELIFPPVPEKAADFFRTAPTGFQVSPVGNVGMTSSLIILQKVGALSSELHDKKLAISLSPEWFLGEPAVRSDWYEKNFSLLAASEIAFGNALDFELKRDIASQMLRVPRTLEKAPVLELALRCLASGQWFDRVVFCAIWPLGKIQTVIMEFQDHFSALIYILHTHKPARLRHSEVLDWSELIAKAELKAADEGKTEKTSGSDKRRIRAWREELFLEHLNTAPEWIDFELLLRTLAKIHAQPLLLSMPMAGHYYDQHGVSRAAREVYYKKMHRLVHQYNFPLVEFEDHDNDPTFLDLQQGRSHLTGKGWMFYNRVLDDFFHGRAPRT